MQRVVADMGTDGLLNTEFEVQYRCADFAYLHKNTEYFNPGCGFKLVVINGRQKNSLCSALSHGALNEAPNKTSEEDK